MRARARWGSVAALAVVVACSAHGERSGRTLDRLGGGSFAYAYDANGLRVAGAPAGADALGRATTYGGTSLAWGPDGALAAAVDASGAETSFVTDETGHRLAWSAGGSVLAAEIDGARMTPGHVEEVVKIGTRAVGRLEDGAFSLTPLDLRGSVTSDGATGPAPSGPYGERQAPPALDPVVDYAGAPADPVLGTIVMGVRDYDPATGAFLSPDPKYLEHPDSCVESPVECSLYGYARAQPADFVDPTGHDAEKKGDTTSGAYSAKSGDPSSIGGLCWDHLPSPGEVARENPGWLRTSDGLAYQTTYLNRLLDAASTARSRALEDASQPRISQCDDCYLADGRPNPARLESPYERMQRETSLITDAGPFGGMLMTGTLAASVTFQREPSMKLLLPALTITNVLDASVGHMGVDTYGELQQYDIDDLRLHMQMTRDKRFP